MFLHQSRFEFAGINGRKCEDMVTPSWRQFLKCSPYRINNTLVRHKDTKENSLRLAVQLYFNKQLITRKEKMIQKDTFWREKHKSGMFSVACNDSCCSCPEMQMRLEEEIKRVYRKPVTETFVLDSWQYFTCVEDLTWVSVVSLQPYLHLKTNQSEVSASIFKRPNCDMWCFV